MQRWHFQTWKVVQIQASFSETEEGPKNSRIPLEVREIRSNEMDLRGGKTEI